MSYQFKVQACPESFVNACDQSLNKVQAHGEQGMESFFKHFFRGNEFVSIFTPKNNHNIFTGWMIVNPESSGEQGKLIINTKKKKESLDNEDYYYLEKSSEDGKSDARSKYIKNLLEGDKTELDIFLKKLSQFSEAVIFLLYSILQQELIKINQEEIQGSPFLSYFYKFYCIIFELLIKQGTKKLCYFPIYHKLPILDVAKGNVTS